MKRRARARRVESQQGVHSKYQDGMARLGEWKMMDPRNPDESRWCVAFRVDEVRNRVCKAGWVAVGEGMSMLADDSPVMTKARELCAEIAKDSRFVDLQKDVERFMNDDEAKLMYQSVHERGSELHQKQHAGVELGAAEIREFEAARDELMSHEVAKSFMDAQGELETLQKAIGKFVGLTLELGRVPTAEDLSASEGGCCGGGGCGC